MGLERLDSHMQKDETGPLSYMIHKNQLQMDWWHECRTWNHKTNRKKITGNKLLDIDFDNGVFEFDNKSKGEKSKSKQVGLHKTENLLYSKGNRQENEKVVKENTCKSCLKRSQYLKYTENSYYSTEKKSN